MKLSVAKKLFLGFLSVLLLFGLVAGLSNYELGNVNRNYQSLLDENVSEVMLVKTLKAELMNEAGGIRGYLLTGDSHISVTMKVPAREWNIISMN